jgi:hypothetical protein
MALFSRRSLQQMLNDNARFLRPEDVEEHVRRLNNVRDDYLSTEWEVSLLNALSKVGRVQHEPDLGGSRFVDTLFSSPLPFEFAADITTISDQPLQKRNPTDRLWEELRRQARKWKIVTGGFDFRVGHRPEVLRGRGVRHDLLLPPVSKLQELIFNKKFGEFIGEIKRLPSRPREYCVRNTTTDVGIYYNPSRKGIWSAGHLSYTGANVLRDNPVFRALKRKAEQLKLCGYRGHKGIIICDGGCRMLAPQLSTHFAEYSIDEIVSEFFRLHSSVAFTAIFAVRHDESSSMGRGHHQLYVRIGVNPRCSGINGPLRSIIDQVIRHMPTPETNAENALQRAKAWPGLPAHFGGLRVEGDKRVKLSAITVQQLLAGTLDGTTFQQGHGFDQSTANLFAAALREGRTIKQCYVERTPDEDDDWITFELGDPDPAVTRFTVPEDRGPSSQKE